MQKKRRFAYLLLRLTVLPAFILATLIPSASAGGRSSALASVARAATGACLIGDIVASTYDAATGEAIVIGTPNAGEPPIDQAYMIDNSSIAIRIARQPQPGVSLEPFMGDPDHHKMLYFPDTLRDTHPGAMLAKADIALKVLSLGVDNDTGQPVSTAVAGYKSIPALLAERGYSPGASLNVSWRLYINLNPHVLLTTDGRNDAAFQSRRVVEVRWAYEQGVPEDPIVTQAVQQFVDHLNQHYDEFAAELTAKSNPALQETGELAKLVALARWLLDKHIPVRLSGMPYHKPPAQASPDLVRLIDAPIGTTALAGGPAASAGAGAIGPFWLYTKPTSAGLGGIGPATIYLRGGVDFSAANTYLNDTGPVQQLAADARSARANNDGCWPFSSSAVLAAGASGGSTRAGTADSSAYTAIAVPLSGSLASVMLPMLLNPPPPPEFATWEVENQTGGSLSATLTGVGSHTFLTGTSDWSDIPPGTYSYTIRSLGGPCHGAEENGEISFDSGETVVSTYTCE